MAELSVLDGLFKEVYGDDINNLVPESSHITKKVSFKKSTQQGKKFVQPVMISQVGGFTVGQNDQAYTLNKSLGMVVKDAEIETPSLVLRQSIPYGQLAQSTTTAGAFANATKLTVEAMIEAITKRNEINFLYGGKSLASWKDTATASGTSATLPIDSGSWSAGIWAGGEGSTAINLYDDSGTLISSGSDAVFVVTAVDVENKELTISGSATGITALATVISGMSSGDLGSIRYAGTAGVEPLGLQAICQTSGTLFNINNTTYSLFKGNDVGVSGPLTLSLLLGAFNNAIAKGLSEETTIYLNPTTWLNLAVNLQSIRHLDASYKSSKIENGTESIDIYTSAGKSSIVPHLFVKEADVFIVPEKRLIRTGASDVTFTIDGMEGRFFRQLEDEAGFELRCFSSQAIFTAHPAKFTYVKIS